MARAATPTRVRVFFDIDGTLLYTDGAGRVAIHAALEQVFGTSGPIDGYIFHGKTDPRIVVDFVVEALDRSPDSGPLRDFFDLLRAQFDLPDLTELSEPAGPPSTQPTSTQPP